MANTRDCSRTFSSFLTSFLPHFLTSQRGIALLLVVSVLAVVTVMAVSLVFSMTLETMAARQFVSSTISRYAAEAGIHYARALLDEDRLSSRLDELTEPWAEEFAGTDVDLDEDGTSEARWRSLADQAGTRVGRYAVRVLDEAGKINLNVALIDPANRGASAADLTRALEAAGVPEADDVAQTIEAFRNGPDGSPGVALVDDDRDGAVDEPDEYQPLALRGDDRRIEALEELAGLAGLTVEQVERLRRVATVYSWDANVSLGGQARTNVNTATAEELLTVLLDTGVSDPWQLAANVADAADADLAMSRLSKQAIRQLIDNQGPLGDWTWAGGSPGYYQTTRTGGSALDWALTDARLASGSFRVRVLGAGGAPVGDVTISGQTKLFMADHDFFDTLSLGATVLVQVDCRPPVFAGCAFQGLEFVPTDEAADVPIVPVRGIEGVRINEVMVDPTLTLWASDAVFDPHGSGWLCPGGERYCINQAGGQGRWTWTHASLKPGRYYLRVFGTQAGQTVGEIRLEVQAATLINGARHPELVTVGADHKFTLTIGKTQAEGTYYFQKLTVSLAPDAQYVELINLTDEAIDVSGWMLDGEALQGRRGVLPDGAVIEPRGVLVAAVDADDAQQGLAGNGVDVKRAWEVPKAAAVAQVAFPSGPPTPDEDWLASTLPDGTPARLILRAPDGIVDEVEYPLPLPTTVPFQSLEKGDPTVVGDLDGNGLDDGWHPSLRLYTPGSANDNLGTRELRDDEQILHDPAQEVVVLNRPFESLGDLALVSGGVPWRRLLSEDLARVVDRLTVQGIRLETEAHLLEGSDDWQETEGGYATSTSGALGRWEWTDVPDGQYRVCVYGWREEQLSVRWAQADGAMSEWIPTRLTDVQGRVVVGQVPVGLEGASPNVLTLEVRCDSPGGVCHVEHVMLDPLLALPGLVNVNTASREVLRCLPGMTDRVADALILSRPYGDLDGKGRGIGDLFLESVLGETEEDKLERFRRFGRLLTVRSSMFEITSLGEAIEGERPGASQRIRAVIQR